MERTTIKCWPCQCFRDFLYGKHGNIGNANGSMISLHFEQGVYAFFLETMEIAEHIGTANVLHDFSIGRATIPWMSMIFQGPGVLSLSLSGNHDLLTIMALPLAYLSTHPSNLMYVCMHECMHACVYVCIYMRVCVHM